MRVGCFILACAFSLAAPLAAARTFVDSASVCDAVPSHVWTAAAKGNLDAQVAAAHAIVQLECGTSPELLAQGLNWLDGAIEQGHLGASVSLALLYHFGGAVEPDLEQAITFYRQAAEGGVVDAQHTLGVLLVSDGDQDHRDEGLYWLGAAAGQGDGVSAAFVGMLHAKGLHGVESNSCLALDWYEASLLLDAPVPVQSFIEDLPSGVRSRC